MEWGDIRVFLQVARTGQMNGASRILNLDHSTISRRIARLEEETGVPLFDRAGRRLSLTEEGAKLLTAAEKLETIILRDVMTLNESRQDVSGRVRIGTSEGFGSYYLSTRLPILLAEHAGLEIELIALPRTYSLGMREVDIAITMDRPETGDIRFKKLTPYTLAAYGSSAYLAEHPAPKAAQDLVHHLWCGYIEELLYTQELDMMRFGDITIRPRYRSTTFSVQLEAALGGAALAILPCYVASQYSALEAVLPADVGIELNYWISVHGDLADSARVRLVMTAIERMVESDKALFLSRPPSEEGASKQSNATPSETSTT